MLKAGLCALTHANPWPKLFLALAVSAGLAQTADPVPDVTVEIFSDFQCPYCRMFAPAAREVESKGIEGINTKVEFKNFPLSFHPFAQLAAQAAMAAREQGKFWEMHDLLFANQNALGREDLLKYAASLKLDMEKFKTDLDSDRIKKTIETDRAEGNAKKVQGTPTFFVNGKEYSGTKSPDELKALVRGEFGRRIALTEITDNLMSKGPAAAPVTIEFFADLESPVSRSANYVLEELMAKYPSDVRLQFRNYPLSFHAQAALAHDAAMTAAHEGHFWEMANYIFDHQESVREQDLIAWAGRLGIDEEKFAATIRKRKYTPRVNADLADGFQRGVRGSPVIFVNGKQIDGVPSLQTLTDYVDAALAAGNAKKPGEVAKK
ncbi:MAG: thioredoxin domain-containing protein [Bryobacteraceae bacterium]|jgi:protein-disulfide isomerase